MDHSWGRNVSEAGLTTLGATLASRIPIFGEGAWLLNVRTPTSTLIWYEPPLDTEIPYGFAVQALPDPTKNFPYGWVVEPDVPL